MGAGAGVARGIATLTTAGSGVGGGRYAVFTSGGASALGIPMVPESLHSTQNVIINVSPNHYFSCTDSQEKTAQVNVLQHLLL